MKRIIRKIKRTILNMQLKRCKIKKVKLNRQFDILCDQIWSEILKGNNEGKVEMMQLKREFITNKKVELIHDEYEIRRAIFGLN
jgi:hypothetical protein